MVAAGAAVTNYDLERADNTAGPPISRQARIVLLGEAPGPSLGAHRKRQERACGRARRPVRRPAHRDTRTSSRRRSAAVRRASRGSLQAEGERLDRRTRGHGSPKRSLETSLGKTPTWSSSTLSGVWNRSMRYARHLAHASPTFTSLRHPTYWRPASSVVAGLAKHRHMPRRRRRDQGSGRDAGAHADIVIDTATSTTEDVRTRAYARLGLFGPRADP